jgi:hypothetical protein
MPDNDETQQPEGQPEQPDSGQQQDDGGKPEPKQDATDWKAKARMWESRAKENSAAAKRLADIEAANQTAQERAEAAAKAAEDRAAAALARAASSDIRSALTEAGVPNAAGIVEDLNLARFLTEDGGTNADAVTALVEKYKPLIPAAGPRAPAPNPGQGNGRQPQTITEQLAGIELKPGDRNATRQSLNLKSRQLIGLRNQQG